MIAVKEKKRKKPISKTRKVINNIFSAIILIIFLLALTAMIFLMIQFIGGKTPSLFGYRFYFVLTDSMSPELKPSDMIFSKIIKENDDIEYVKGLVGEGDIVTYQGKIGGREGLITHRVIKSDQYDDVFFYDEDTQSWMLITRGDNNLIDDPAISITALDAVMVKKATAVSTLYNFISKKIGGMVLILIPIVLILIPFIIRLIVVLKTPAEEEMKEMTEQEKAKLEEEIARKAVEEFITKQQDASSADKDTDTATPADKDPD